MAFIASNFKQPLVDGFLGHNFLSRYKVFIDFNQEALFVKSPKGFFSLSLHSFLNLIPGIRSFPNPGYGIYIQVV